MGLAALIMMFALSFHWTHFSTRRRIIAGWANELSCLKDNEETKSSNCGISRIFSEADAMKEIYWPFRSVSITNLLGVVEVLIP